MVVDKTNVKDVLENYEFITNELIRIGADIPWDLPVNVRKCRDIYEKRLRRKLKDIVNSEEGKEYSLKLCEYLY